MKNREYETNACIESLIAKAKNYHPHIKQETRESLNEVFVSCFKIEKSLDTERRLKNHEIISNAYLTYIQQLPKPCIDLSQYDDFLSYLLEHYRVKDGHIVLCSQQKTIKNEIIKLLMKH
jgi:hypothetical protein